MTATAQLPLALGPADHRGPSRVVADALEAIGRARMAALHPGDVWAPSPHIERGFDPQTTDRGRFNAALRAAAEASGLSLGDIGPPEQAGPDPLWHDPLVSEAWQRYVAPRGDDGVVHCVHVSRDVSRLDVRVRGVTILGAALMGCGGIYRDMDTLADAQEALDVFRRNYLRSGAMYGQAWAPAYFRVVYTARHCSGFAAPVDAVEVLRVQPAERRVVRGRRVA